MSDSQQTRTQRTSGGSRTESDAQCRDRLKQRLEQWQLYVGAGEDAPSSAHAQCLDPDDTADLLDVTCGGGLAASPPGHDPCSGIASGMAAPDALLAEALETPARAIVVHARVPPIAAHQDAAPEPSEPHMRRAESLVRLDEPTSALTADGQWLHSLEAAPLAPHALAPVRRRQHDGAAEGLTDTAPSVFAPGGSPDGRHRYGMSEAAARDLHHPRSTPEACAAQRVRRVITHLLAALLFSTMAWALVWLLLRNA